MPGFNGCGFIGTLLSISAVVLLIFVNVSQIRPSQVVPRHLRLVTIDTSNLGQGVLAATGGTGNVPANFYGNGNTQGGAGTGVRNFYEYGLWNGCASADKSGTADYCFGSGSFGFSLNIPNDILNDVPQQYQQAVNQALPQSTFTSNGYLNIWTKIAFYFIFVGTIIAGISMFLSLASERFAWLLCALFSLAGAVAVSVGAIIWTILIVRLRGAVNDATVGNGTSLGVYVSWGNCLWLTWAAAGALWFAFIPYLVGCITGKRNRDHGEDYEAETTYGAPSRMQSVNYGGPSSRHNSVRGSRYATSERATSVRY